MNTNIYGDFQIYISAPLRKECYTNMHFFIITNKKNVKTGRDVFHLVMKHLYGKYCPGHTEKLPCTNVIPPAGV